MRSCSVARRTLVAGAAMLFAGAAAATGWISPRVNVTVSGTKDVRVQAIATPAAVMLTNESDTAVRCRVDFHKGLAPEGGRMITVKPHGRWIERSPVAGETASINVDARCG